MALFLWLLDFLPHRRLAVGREVGCGVVPKPVDKVVEGSDTGDIPRLETGEDSEELRCVQGFDPVCEGNDIHHNHQQQGSQHTGRWTRFSSTGGILILHDTIHSREIEFSETEVDLSNCRRLGSPVDPIHASNSIQKPSVVEVRVDYGFQPKASNRASRCPGARAHLFSIGRRRRPQIFAGLSSKLYPGKWTRHFATTLYRRQ